jgi:hypothetical protein
LGKSTFPLIIGKEAAILNDTGLGIGNIKNEDYKIYTGEPTKILNDNDIIDIDSRKIRVTHSIQVQILYFSNNLLIKLVA